MNEYLETIFIEKNLNEQRRTIAEITQSSPMFDCIASQICNRQLVDTNGHRLNDFATQDYLGFSFRPEVIRAADEGAQEFGTFVPWCRLVGALDLYNDLESRVAGLVGTEACSIFTSTTLINHGVIPALLGKNGVMFLDKSGHMTMYEGAKIARDSGSTLVSFPGHDLAELESLLIQYKNAEKKLICVDGVNSMTGNYCDLPALNELAKKYKALLYVDDAHGFGVVGENPDSTAPYGHKGNGLVKYFGLDYDNILYVACFSKAYGAFGAFVACSRNMRSFLISQATPHDLGGNAPPSAMCAVKAGLVINRAEGEVIRQRIARLTQKTLDGLQSLGFETSNTTGFPIIPVKIPDSRRMIEISKTLYENNILLTLAPYPMVRKGDEVLRISVTGSNTEAEVDQLLETFSAIKRHFK